MSKKRKERYYRKKKVRSNCRPAVPETCPDESPGERRERNRKKNTTGGRQKRGVGSETKIKGGYSDFGVKGGKESAPDLEKTHKSRNVEAINPGIWPNQKPVREEPPEGRGRRNGEKRKLKSKCSKLKKKKEPSLTRKSRFRLGVPFVSEIRRLRDPKTVWDAAVEEINRLVGFIRAESSLVVTA